MLQQKDQFDGKQRTVALDPWEPLTGTLWERVVMTHVATLAECDVLEKPLEAAITMLRECRGKILILGNGGSAAQAQHFAAELIVRYERERPGIPAIALTADTSVITAAGNDFGYHDVFRRQVEALARPDDIVVAISTSGKSANVYTACHAAGARGCKVIALTGLNGLYDYAPDIELRVPSTITARVQEIHALLIHAICEGIEAP